jgi:hypothetical protein
LEKAVGKIDGRPYATLGAVGENVVDQREGEFVTDRIGVDDSVVIYPTRERHLVRLWYQESRGGIRGVGRPYSSRVEVFLNKSLPSFLIFAGALVSSFGERQVSVLELYLTEYIGRQVVGVGDGLEELFIVSLEVVAQELVVLPLCKYFNTLTYGSYDVDVLNVFEGVVIFHLLSASFANDFQFRGEKFMVRLRFL